MATFSPEHAALFAAKTSKDFEDKQRLHLAAKVFGVRAGELASALAAVGVEGKKSQSMVTREELERLLDAVAPAKKATKKAAKKSAKTTAKTTAKSTAKDTADTPAKKATKDTTKTATKKVTKKAAKTTAAKASKKAAEKASKKAQPQVEVSAVESADAAVLDTVQDTVHDTAQDTVQDTVAKQPAAVEAAKPAAQEATPDANQGVAAADAERPAVKTTRRRVIRRVVGSRAVARQSTQDATTQDATTQDAATEEVPASAAPERPAAKATRKRASNKTEQPAEPAVDPETLHPAERETQDLIDEPQKLKGSVRLESQRKWRAENKTRVKNISRSEFLARRESVQRTMLVRDSRRSDRAGNTTQVGVLEDGMLVEHFVTSETQQSTVGNVYLGRVQNVLASMEAAFIDIGTGRNGVLYAGEMNWKSEHLHSNSRKIEQALRPGDLIMVQVMKDPLGHKGARLTARISFAGRYLVYFPGGTTAGISRRLPQDERRRLKSILDKVIPNPGGAIIRTAAENATEEHIHEDVHRLLGQWEELVRKEQAARKGKNVQPIALYEEPTMLVKVIRDLFNEDFQELIVDGAQSWDVVRNYVGRMAPELKKRVRKFDPAQDGIRSKQEIEADKAAGLSQDVFRAFRVDEQLTKALARKVWLPSGGYLIIERTEAMTVIDVNTGSFVGSGGDLEETLTQNNLEAAEEIVRQMRLRDMGGMIVIDFIDMVLEENQDLVLRRLSEFLGRDRTRHKVSEVTSLGLVQVTRKRLGTGLLETFSTPCEACDGRGIIIHADPVDHEHDEAPRRDHGNRKERQAARKQRDERRHEQRDERQDERRDEQREEQRSQQAHADTADQVDQRETIDADSARVDAGQQATELSRTARRQRNRRRGVVQARLAAKDNDDQAAVGRLSDSTEELIDRILQDEAQAEVQDRPASRAPEQEQSAAQQGKQTASTRRRVRRVVRKTTSVSEPVKEASAAVAEEATQPSFAQAQEEFARSPRRRRRTRGNSKSDHAPQPQDFGADVTAAKTAKEPETPVRGGRRRRVVRRVTQS